MWNVSCQLRIVGQWLHQGEISKKRINSVLRPRKYDKKRILEK